MNKKLVTVIALLFALVMQGCGTGSDSTANRVSQKQNAIRESIDVITNDVSKEIAKVTRVSQGKKGAPVVVLEERHDSRAVQIQLAIVLNRLYNSHNVRNIVLEGYLKEDPEINTEWYQRAASKSQASAHSVAVRLLQEGEINSAEFIKLAYGDSIVIPAETQSEYPTDIPDESDVMLTCLNYLYQLALKSPKPALATKLTRMMQEVNDLEGDENVQEVKMKALRKFIFSQKPSDLSDDPWIKRTTEYFTNPEQSANMQLEQEITLFEEIQRRAEAASLQEDPQEKRNLDQFLTFLRKRSAASKTMVDVAAPVADRPDVSAVVMIIGAAHTNEVSRLLEASGRPFAVVRPQVLDIRADVSSIPGKMYERKRQRLSLYSEGITKTLLESFPASHSIKPPPVLQQQWFEAKAELYLYTDRIAETLLGNGGGGSKPPATSTIAGGTGEPPFGFGGDDFRGKSIYIDPKRISIVADDNEGRRYAVLFPVEMNPNNPALRKTIWVKAGRVGDSIPPLNERDRVEAMLKESLQEVDGSKNPGKGKRTKASDGKKPEKSVALLEASKKVEDKVGRIKITRETVATFATSEQAARRTVVSRL